MDRYRCEQHDLTQVTSLDLRDQLPVPSGLPYPFLLHRRIYWVLAMCRTGGDPCPQAVSGRARNMADKYSDKYHGGKVRVSCSSWSGRASEDETWRTQSSSPGKGQSEEHSRKPHKGQKRGHAAEFTPCVQTWQFTQVQGWVRRGNEFMVSRTGHC